jgi:hypothetical protein
MSKTTCGLRSSEMGPVLGGYGDTFANMTVGLRIARKGQ